ncbi:hypothetical protein BHM03_00001655 [Ensete ventricosum]|nr:hypothetical protein BHM03_00001655 [Ensete ventricosum]
MKIKSAHRPNLLWGHHRILKENDRENLDLLEERRAEAHLKTLHYQRAVARLYNQKVRPRPIGMGDLVLRKVDVSNPRRSRRKLAPEMGGRLSVPSISKRALSFAQGFLVTSISKQVLSLARGLSVSITSKRALSLVRGLSFLTIPSSELFASIESFPVKLDDCMTIMRTSD